MGMLKMGWKLIFWGKGEHIILKKGSFAIKNSAKFIRFWEFLNFFLKTPIFDKTR